MSEENKFENIKEGDYVLISCRWQEYVAQVSHVTKTRFVASNITFNKKRGWSIGTDSYSMKYATILTEEKKNELLLAKKKKDLTSYIIENVSSDMDIKVLENIANLIKKIISKVK